MDIKSILYTKHTKDTILDVLKNIDDNIKNINIEEGDVNINDHVGYSYESQKNMYYNIKNGDYKKLYKFVDEELKRTNIFNNWYIIDYICQNKISNGYVMNDYLLYINFMRLRFKYEGTGKIFTTAKGTKEEIETYINKLMMYPKYIIMKDLYSVCVEEKIITKEETYQNIMSYYCKLGDKELIIYMINNKFVITNENLNPLIENWCSRTFLKFLDEINVRCDLNNFFKFTDTYYGEYSDDDEDVDVDFNDSTVAKENYKKYFSHLTEEIINDKSYRYGMICVEANKLIYPELEYSELFTIDHLILACKLRKGNILDILLNMGFIPDHRCMEEIYNLKGMTHKNMQLLITKLEEHTKDISSLYTEKCLVNYSNHSYLIRKYLDAQKLKPIPTQMQMINNVDVSRSEILGTKH